MLRRILAGTLASKGIVTHGEIYWVASLMRVGSPVSPLASVKLSQRPTQRPTLIAAFRACHVRAMLKLTLTGTLVSKGKCGDVWYVSKTANRRRLPGQPIGKREAEAEAEAEAEPVADPEADPNCRFPGMPCS